MQTKKEKWLRRGSCWTWPGELPSWSVWWITSHAPGSKLACPGLPGSRQSLLFIQFWMRSTHTGCVYKYRHPCAKKWCSLRAPPTQQITPMCHTQAHPELVNTSWFTPIKWTAFPPFWRDTYSRESLPGIEEIMNVALASPWPFHSS